MQLKKTERNTTSMNKEEKNHANITSRNILQWKIITYRKLFDIFQFYKNAKRNLKRNLSRKIRKATRKLLPLITSGIAVSMMLFIVSNMGAEIIKEWTNDPLFYNEELDIYV